MQIELNEEQKMFQKAIRQFAEKEIAPLVEEAEAKEQFPLALFPKMGSLGYLCVRYSTKYGAAGMGKVSECILVEELARMSGGIASAIMVHNGLGTAIIYEFGSEEQKQRFLVPAIRGVKVSAFGLTEPNAGSDAAAVETRAVKTGKGYVLNGSKIFITNGTICDYVLTVTYTDKSKGPRGGVSVFIVEKGTPGFRVAKKFQKLGNRPSETGELVFEDCPVPRENLVGEEGRGFPYVIANLSGGRIAHCFRSLGVAQAAYEASLKYSQERVQFGQPIAKFQATQFKLARMAMELEAGRWLGFRAAYMFDQGQRLMKEASMAKLFASEVVLRITSEAMQMRGGYGYMLDSPVQRYFRDARLYTVTEGTSEIQHLVIAREIGLS